MYSNPPIHGARIVAKVLTDPRLKPLWYTECKAMADRYGPCVQLAVYILCVAAQVLVASHGWRP
jgi:aspartate/tyrosine/aromatic aminotransferase